MRVALVACALLASCSDVYYPLRDAPVPDALLGEVTVSLGVPSPGIRVYFQDGPHDPATLVMTAADGRATGMVRAGGFVTVINPYRTALGTELRTFAGVSPGDVLNLAPAPEGVVGGPHIKVRVPIDPTPNVTYKLRAPCTQLGNPTQVTAGYAELDTTLEGCGAITDLLVWTELPGGALNRSLAEANVPIVDQAVIDLTSKSYAAPTTLSINTSGVPPAMSAAASAALYTEKGSLYEAGGSISVTPTTTNLTLPEFPGSIAHVEISVYLGREDQVITRHVAPTATLNVNVEPVLLSALAACPVFTSVPSELTWLESSNGEVADLVAATVVIHRATTDWTWSVMGPRDRALALPNLGLSWVIESGDPTTIGDFFRARVPGGFASVLGSTLRPGGWLYQDLRARDGAVLARSSVLPPGCLSHM